MSLAYYTMDDLRLGRGGFLRKGWTIRQSPELGEALELYESCRKEKERSVELEFYDVRNLADRLLTELSPWKKYCSYSQRDDRYRLKLCYPEMDEAELTARLMGFGADIRIRDREHSISREIRRRLDRQLELIGEEQALM